jgi:signal transduction histidine kinase
MDRLRILVVDDELGMRMGVARALRDMTVPVPEVGMDVAFEIGQAETGEQALEKIAENAPHIVLLDHKLPGISGLEVLEQMASGEHSSILTIMITAYASIETAVTATKRGAYDFLAKPFTPEELKDVVRKAATRIVLEQQARQLAAERRQVRFEFVRVLGHELKAPLAAVEGYIDMLDKRSLGDDLPAYDQLIDRSLLRLEQMRKLIVDLLDLTRIESGQKERELSEIDLAEAAKSSVELNGVPASERDISIELHTEGPTTLKGDRGELEMVLNNLISNAVKYNRDGGRVDVTLRGKDGTLAVEVADTGIGMSPKEKDKLFGEFVRIKNPKTRNILGSGLGLSIVRKIVQLYDGSIDVESQPDKGSTFAVTLPRGDVDESP